MEVKNVKGNNPELLVDFNGNAVQAWPLGGRTIPANPAQKLIAKSSLIRISNPSDTLVYLFRLVQGRQISGDMGFPIFPKSSEYFACEIGDEFSIKGAELFVTFLREPDTQPIFDLIGSSFNRSQLSQGEVSWELPDKKVAIVSGFIDYCYEPSKLGHWITALISPVQRPSSIKDRTPNATVIIEKDNGTVYQFSMLDMELSDAKPLSIDIPISRPGEIILIKLDWDGTGMTEDVLTLKVGERIILRNG